MSTLDGCHGQALNNYSITLPRNGTGIKDKIYSTCISVYLSLIFISSIKQLSLRSDAFILLFDSDYIGGAVWRLCEWRFPYFMTAPHILSEVKWHKFITGYGVIDN